MAATQTLLSRRPAKMVAPLDLSHLSTLPSPLLSSLSSSDSSLDSFDLASDPSPLYPREAGPASPGRFSSSSSSGSAEFLASLVGEEYLASLAGAGKGGRAMQGKRAGGGMPSAGGVRRCATPPIDYCGTQARRGMMLASAPPEWAHVSAQVSPGLAYQRHASQELKWRPPYLQLDGSNTAKGHAPLAWTLSAPCMLRNRDGHCLVAGDTAGAPCHRLPRQGSAGGLQVEQLASLKAMERGASKLKGNAGFPCARATTEGFGPKLNGATSAPNLAPGGGSPLGSHARAGAGCAGGTPTGLPVASLRGEKDAQWLGGRSATVDSPSQAGGDHRRAGAQEGGGEGSSGSTAHGPGGDDLEEFEGVPLLAPSQEVASRRGVLVARPSLRVGGSSVREPGGKGKRVRWRDFHGELLVAVQEFDIRDSSEYRRHDHGWDVCDGWGSDWCYSFEEWLDWEEEEGWGSGGGLGWCGSNGWLRF